MAACSAGDREEVAALLRQGADINHANVDGLTALHQVGSFDSVTVLNKVYWFVSELTAELLQALNCRSTNGNGSALIR